MALLVCATAKQSTFCNAKQCTFWNAKQYQIKMHCKRCTWLIMIISNVLLLVLQKISLCQTINQYMHRPTGSCYCLILCLQACLTGQQMITCSMRPEQTMTKECIFISKSYPQRDQVLTPSRSFIDACVMRRNIWGTSHYCNCQVHLQLHNRFSLLFLYLHYIYISYIW